VFVVVWEPKRGIGGGHQLVMDKGRAERVSRTMMQERPEDTISVLSAYDYGAAALLERDFRSRGRQRAANQIANGGGQVRSSGLVRRPAIMPPRASR
jgi:hypothetical protein